MKRIIYHWSAGGYKPNSTDKKHYHYIIDDKGEIHEGIFKPEDNENCNDGRYARHTGGGNTSSVGIAFSGMFGFTSKSNIGKYPLTKKQCETGFLLGAKLAKKYNIDLSDRFSIQTHYGFGVRNPKTTSYGKIDIVYLPPYPDVEKEVIEDFIRTKVRWYFEKIK